MSATFAAVKACVLMMRARYGVKPVLFAPSVGLLCVVRKGQGGMISVTAQVGKSIKAAA